MDPRDDIELSFFDDEPATTESAGTRARLPRRGGSGSGPRRPARPARNPTPVLRLLGLVAVAIVVLLFFGLLVESCASTSKHDTYAHYMDSVDPIAKSSAANGQQVANALTSPSATPASLVTKLSGIAAQERQNVTAAEHLSPPGRLRSENLQLVEALQLRVDGTQGLANTFQATAKTKSSNDAQLLLDQSDKLLASDVVYADLFAGPSVGVMKEEGVVGVEVPPSKYITNPDQLTLNYWSLALDRLRGTTTSGTGTTTNALHGTNIASTKVGGQALQVSPAAGFNTINASTSPTFEVTVHNGGTAQEVRIPVTLTIEVPGKTAIVKTQTISLINPSTDVTLTFPITEQVPFAKQTQVKVDVSAVPHEHDVTNNSATYPVLFSLGG